MLIRPLQPSDRDEWRRMRVMLWPEHSAFELDLEIARFEAEQRLTNEPMAVFVAERAGGGLGGFIEVALRRFADACCTSPVGYIEGWHVDTDLHRRGVGRALIEAAEKWARQQGCFEMASDCNPNNSVSYEAHIHSGYAPTNRSILFRKPLTDLPDEPHGDWIAIVPHELWIGTALKLVLDTRAGGIDIFLGTTREERSTDGRELVALDYEAYEQMALEQMKKLAARAREKWPIIKLALLHRVGRVSLGDPSVIIAVATPHRGDAFDACRFLIDELKKDVAIWKKEVWSDGDESWVHPDRE